MSDSKVNWWMDASCRWHQGRPPPGWWQAGDRRWHPPAPDAIEEMATGPPMGGAHLGGRGPGLWEAYRRWPRWARLAAPIAVFVIAIGMLGAAATEGLRGSDPDTTAGDEATATTDPEPSTTAPDIASPAPTAGPTTTDPEPSTTAPPPPDPAATTAPAPAPTNPEPTNSEIHPGAPCSPEGATALSGDGVPLTCTRQKCHGADFSQPRWRRTSC